MPRGYLDETLDDFAESYLDPSSTPYTRRRRRKAEASEPKEEAPAELAPKLLSLEHLMCSEEGFGLTTATPLQRAIFRASDGQALGNLWKYKAVKQGFGERPPVGAPPSIMLVLAAIRCAKSMMAAAKVFLCSQTVDLKGVKVGDQVRIPVLATDKDAASATFAHLSEVIQSVPAFKARLIGKPKTDSLVLRHPSGHPIQVKVTALSRYGSTVVSRWLAGIICDEAPRMGGEVEAVKNITEAMRASRGRILPGGQTWIVGSPWAPMGPVYEMVLDHEGKPTQALVVVRARGPDMNPVYWTPERCEDLRKKDPAAYQTDVEARFADPEDTFFPSVLVEEAMRPEVNAELEPTEGVPYVAVLDPGSSGPNWLLVVLGTYGLGGPGGAQPLLRVTIARQWVGHRSKPLSPDATLRAVADTLRPFGLDWCYTPSGKAASLVTLAERHDLQLIEDQSDKAERDAMIEDMLTPISHSTLELGPSRVMREHLISVRKRDGKLEHVRGYVLPLALAVARAPDPPEGVEPIYDETERAHLAYLDSLETDPCNAAAERMFQ